MQGIRLEALQGLLKPKPKGLMIAHGKGKEPQRILPIPQSRHNLHSSPCRQGWDPLGGRQKLSLRLSELQDSEAGAGHQ